MAWSNGQYNGKLQQIISPALSSISRDQQQGRGIKRNLHQYDDFNDDEDDDESSNMSGAAEKRQRLTVEQVSFLETSFNMDLKLEPERKAQIAKQLGIRPRKVAIWFQNRRARWKNKQLEQDYEILKADYEALIKDKENMIRKNEEIVEENNKLQAEVSRLKSLLERRCNRASSLTAECMVAATFKEERLSSKSELTSPTKHSVEDRSDVQDSGQSFCPSCHHEETEVVTCMQESTQLTAVKVLQGEDSAVVFPVDDPFPLFSHQPFATNHGLCIEFGGHLPFNPYEDNFGGFTSWYL